MFSYKKIAILAISLTLLGCATDDPNRRAKTGAAIGAIAGAIIGHQIDHDSGRFAGAALGALAGGVTGDYMDKQQQEFERALLQEQKQHDLEIQRLEDESLKIDISNEVSFDFAKSDIKQAFRSTLNKIVALLNKYDRTQIEVVGHTDNIGSDNYNLQLSEQRAENVANYFVSHGVAPGRLTVVAAGEYHPRATNATEAGRQLNRRVEIIIKPLSEHE